MTDFTKIDKVTTKAIADGTIAAIQAFAEEHGLTARYAGGKYDPTAGKVTLKIEVALTSIDGAKVEWDRYCSLYQLTPDDYGRTFTYRNVTYTLKGFRPRAPKRPISASDSDGRTFSFPDELVRLALQREDAA